jgi:putative radical SAM enzyme (TIGR03279 family)
LVYTELFETLYPINTPKKEKGVEVTGVDSSGLGHEIGIEVGDRITRVNGRELRDFLDWQYYTGSEDKVLIDVVKGSGEAWQVEVEIGEGETWGLDFDYFAPRQCANDCIFCFCNQNPAGARQSLFFKDEDTRLSFLHGNYTTMSSISKLELDRIVEQRLSPQYVSVHATDPEVRRYLLGRKRADDVLAKMRYLGEHGIELHAQIVLCPTINDGDVFTRTINDLAELHPALTSVAVVPVVFTRLHNYRDRLTSVTREFAASLIKRLRPIQREFRERFGSAFVFLADEFYLRAGLAVPGRAHYGEYPQIEDGVGMVRRFVAAAGVEMKCDLGVKAGVKVGDLFGTIATGELFSPILSGIVDKVNVRFGSRIRVVGIPNRFFGEEVTVAGLIAGGDILAAREAFEGDFLIVPEQACLKSGNTFLDDMTLAGVQRGLGVAVSHGGPSLSSMLQAAAAAAERRGAGHDSKRAGSQRGRRPSRGPRFPQRRNNCQDL